MAVPPDVPEPLRRRAKAAAEWLQERRDAGQTVTVVHHIDADGVTSGAIAAECLEQAGIPYRMHHVRSLDDAHIADVKESNPEALWFTDLGSAGYMHFAVPRLVCDHHELVRDGSEEAFVHVNPLLDDLPGDSISGAGCAWLCAAAYGDATDLLPLALVGAAGDLQDRGGFAGTNAILLEMSVEVGLVHAELDLAWFGVETRKLPSFIAYADEPAVPGLAADMAAVKALLAALDVPADTVWSALTDAQRIALRSAFVDRLLDAGRVEDVDDLWRQVVTIVAEQPGQPTHELREFATLLNSTARYDEPEIGLAVARGNRGAAFDEALDLRTGHKKHLQGALRALEARGVQQQGPVQWVHLENQVRDTVVGIVCGMALPRLSQDHALVAFAYRDASTTKVSSRLPGALQGRVDLSEAMRVGCEAVGGQGGGHAGAAGASIPRGDEQAFLESVIAEVANQLQPAVADFDGVTTMLD